MVVGFVHLYGYGLGDNVIAMEALYALKNVHTKQHGTKSSTQDSSQNPHNADFADCKVVLFSVGGAMKQLVSQVNFIDEYYELNDYLSQDSLKIINKYHYDYLIITKFYRHIFPLLTQINARKIIIACKGANIFLPLLPKYKHIRTIPIRNLFLQKIGIRTHCLKMVRAINPKHYDKQIKMLDCNNAKVQSTQTNKQNIDKFLESNNAQNRTLILVNPFNIASAYTLTLDGFFELMLHICKLQNLITQGGGQQYKINTIKPIVITYPKVHNEFISKLNKRDDIKNSVLVFQNNDDLLNLAEMISRCEAVISPSTGIIHLASNLGVKTIGLYEKSECAKWSTKDNNYILLKSPKSSLSTQAQSLAIQQTISLLTQIL